MKSIQARLAIGVLVSVTVMLLIQWFVINKSIHSLSEEYLSSRLQHDADALVSALVINDQGIELDDNRLGPIYHQPYSGHYYQISFSANGEKSLIRSRSLWDTVMVVPQSTPGKAHIARPEGPDRQQLLMLSQGYIKQGVSFTVAVAEDLTPINLQIRQFLRLHTWMTLSILAALLVIQFMLVRGSLRPLEVIRHELTEMQSGERDSISDNVPSEILALVTELNRNIDSMRRKIQRSRESAGNLAHALKRPLTLLRQLLETTESELPEFVRQKLDNYIVDIQGIIDSELKRARLAGRTIGASRYPLLPAVDDLVNTLKSMYHNKPLTFDVHIPAHMNSPVEREDLYELLGNLLDNACKWAKSRVSVTVTENNTHTNFIVEDDGDTLRGSKPADLNQMLHRGKRLDESTPGHGLGLSIVSSVSEAYGGVLTLARSELGGLLATVSIPK